MICSSLRVNFVVRQSASRPSGLHRATCFSVSSTSWSDNRPHTDTSRDHRSHQTTHEVESQQPLWTLWRRLLPYVCNYKASCARPGTLTLGAKRQSARMSKITNDGLTRSALQNSCTHMATVGVKGFIAASNRNTLDIYQCSSWLKDMWRGMAGNSAAEGLCLTHALAVKERGSAVDIQ